MLRALWTAASGMSAQQLNVDTIANNLANVNTSGFKKLRVDYQDLYYQTLKEPGAAEEGGVSPTGLEVGMGTYPVSTQKIFTPGDLENTENPLDLAIEGAGFFQVSLPDGNKAYSRSGTFRLDAEGRVVTADGYLLEPALTVPADTTEITVSLDGTVSAKSAASPVPSVIGNLELATFSNPPGLKSLGHSLYAETAASGAPLTGTPGAQGVGSVRQGMLEMSNVRVVDEMVNMITAQRAYELSSKAIQTADEMIRLSNNLRG
ncbi:MAG TPA: flagellar basal-body rod protein FlgG [Elusimicrobiota bacterium]|nr:flagellar basal-body rod protein FlgG [Elusimicrobiota bacterium]